MQDENRQDIEAVEDKKARTMRIWRIVGLLAAALLAVLSVLLMMVGSNKAVSYDGASWLSAIITTMMPVITVLLAVLALMNLKKDRPRLLMLNAGSVAFFGAYMLAVGWTPALLMLISGFLAFALTAVRQARLNYDEPRGKVKGKTLVISGVLAILNGIVQIGYAMLVAILMASYYGYPQVSTVYFFIGLGAAVGSFALAAACFNKNRKTSVFYRMFFLGSIVVLTVNMLTSIAASLQIFGMSLVSYIYFGANAAVLAVLVMVLIHAIRMRPKKAEEAVAGEEAAEAEEEGESADDEVDETIGLYKEDEEEDETIGLYKEDEADAGAGEPAEDGAPSDEDKQDK